MIERRDRVQPQTIMVYARRCLAIRQSCFVICVHLRHRLSYLCWEIRPRQRVGIFDIRPDLVALSCWWRIVRGIGIDAWWYSHRGKEARSPIITLEYPIHPPLSPSPQRPSAQFRSALCEKPCFSTNQEASPSRPSLTDPTKHPPSDCHYKCC